MTLVHTCFCSCGACFLFLVCFSVFTSLVLSVASWGSVNLAVSSSSWEWRFLYSYERYFFKVGKFHKFYSCYKFFTHVLLHVLCAVFWKFSAAKLSRKSTFPCQYRSSSQSCCTGRIDFGQLILLFTTAYQSGWLMLDGWASKQKPVCGWMAGLFY